MEEKERYELNDNDCLLDNDNNIAICDFCELALFPDIVVDLLNKQDARIKELAEENEQLKKQLEEIQDFIKLYDCDNFEEFKSFIGSCRLTPAEKEIAIVDLQKQLKEKDKEIAELEEITDSIVSTAYYKLARTDEIIKLKAQLHSQPKEIVDKIRKSIHYYPIALLDSDKEPRIKTLGISKEVLDTILEKYQK